MEGVRVLVPVEQSGTEGVCNVPPGSKLVALELPALDSTTITPSLRYDNTTFRPCADAAGTTITCGGTTTGNEIVQVPEAVSLMTLSAVELKLTVASQTSAARSIYALFVKEP